MLESLEYRLPICAVACVLVGLICSEVIASRAATKEATSIKSMVFLRRIPGMPLRWYLLSTINLLSNTHNNTTREEYDIAREKMKAVI